MAAIQTAPVPAHQLVYEPNSLPKLRSNYGDFLDQDTVGWMRETLVDTSIEEMRRRFDEDGYIFVKGVMPREDVLNMRTSARDGIFDETQDPVAHHGNGGRDLPEDQLKIERLISAHTHPIYEAFLEHPQLRQFVREFMGWKKDVLIKRTLLRHNVPNGFSTGIHYDKIFLRAGDADFLTAWVPIGDCTATGGGLMYLENSTDIGLAMEADFTKRAETFTKEQRINGFNQNMARDGQLSHDAAELTREIENGVHGGEKKKRKWIVANYEAGDVVFHNPYMIHGAIKNDDDKGRIRLSTDLRFHEEGSDLDTRWMRSVWTPSDGL
ncbi:Putative phytanoyl-CoA dioxygenase [Septoria linicola]|uniref:Phytanoyl-CoA dioxygenase n=1 Tax=Septoria linicola TaxID=215465 RepID=A0A9Q9EIX4_9PEZI|nr:Putative phytanoyl-CoA dioxygenase [Septoria linicola]